MTTRELPLDTDPPASLPNDLPVRDEAGDAPGTGHQDISGLRATLDRVETAHQQMAALAIESLAIQENERKRLSRELHDEIGQTLTALKITLGAARRNCRVSPALCQLDQAIDIADGLIDTVRDIARRLRPTQLDELGLAATLRWHLDKTPFPEGMKVSFEENIGERRFSPEVELCCFRVAQEALSNVRRHAGADHVSLRLRGEDHRLDLAIADDGLGFDPEEIARRPSGNHPLGLLGMRERVAALGGGFDLRSRPGQGVAIEVSIPL